MARTDAGEDLVARYRENYRFRDGVHVTEEMVIRHWELECRLRTELLCSSPQERWEVFEEGYDRLHSELSWLDRRQGEPTPAELADRYAKWVEVIGRGNDRRARIRAVLGPFGPARCDDPPQPRGSRHSSPPRWSDNFHLRES